MCIFLCIVSNAVFADVTLKIRQLRTCRLQQMHRVYLSIACEDVITDSVAPAITRSTFGLLQNLVERVVVYKQVLVVVLILLMVPKL